MDEAGCLFSLAAIETDAAQGHAYYQAAARLLEQMGATQWLAGKSLADPPSLPLTI